MLRLTPERFKELRPGDAVMCVDTIYGGLYKKGTWYEVVSVNNGPFKKNPSANELMSNRDNPIVYIKDDIAESRWMANEMVQNHFEVADRAYKR
jgi:hypothetical protein